MRNVERLANTRQKLLSCARRLFEAKGYAGAGTEDILKAAALTRGALYHHFRDKSDLFEAVCMDVSLEARDAVEQATAGLDDPLEALQAGSAVWIAFVLQPGVRQLLLIDAPSVLGTARWNAIDEAYSFQLLREGVRAALEVGALTFPGDSDDLAIMLNGAMNAIVLRSASANSAEVVERQASIAQLLVALSKR